MRSRISIVYLVLYFSYGGFDILFPIYLKEELKLGSAEVSSILSLLPLSMIFMAPMWGWLCDRTQRTQLIFGGSTLAATVVVLLVPFAQAFRWVLLLIGLQCVLQSSVNLIIEEFTQSYAERHRLKPGQLRSWYTIGLASGGLLISFLADVLVGSVIIFPIYAITLVLIVLLFTKPLGTQGSAVQEVPSVHPKERKGVLTRPLLLVLLVVMLGLGTTESYNAMMGMLFKAEGASSTMIGVCFCVSLLIEFAIMNRVDIWQERWGGDRLILLALGLLLLRWLLLAGFPHLGVLLSTQLLQSITTGILIPWSYNQVFRLADRHREKTSMALRDSVVSAAWVGLINLNGWVWQGALTGIGMGNAALSGAALLCYLLFMKQRRAV